MRSDRYKDDYKDNKDNIGNTENIGNTQNNGIIENNGNTENNGIIENNGNTENTGNIDSLGQGEELKKERIKLKVFFCVLIMLCYFGYLAYSYYSTYFNVIKVDVWELIEEPSYVGVEGEGTINPITYDEKKLNKFLKTVEEENTTDRADKLEKFLKEFEFEVTPSEKLSNNSTVTVKCSFDAKKADKYRFAINTESGAKSSSTSSSESNSKSGSKSNLKGFFDGILEVISTDVDNSSPISKKYQVEGLRKQATDSQIIEQLKTRLSGKLPNSNFVTFYKLTKGEDETRIACIVSTKETLSLRYVCYLTEKITPSNALTVSCSEYKADEKIRDYNKFVKYFKEDGYWVSEI